MIIRGNKIFLNNNELEFDKNVLEAIEYQSKIIVVLDSNEIDNVFCYSFDAKMLWKMDSSEITNVGTDKDPCIGVRLVDEKCVAFDFFGRKYILIIDNGKVEKGEILR